MENGESSSGRWAFTFDRDFHDIVSDKQVLRRTTEKFLNNMIDQITLGIIFDEHRKAKINGFDLNGDNAPPLTEQNDLILQQNSKRNMEPFNCPHCEKVVAAFKFAPHLEKCMLKGRRKSARRKASSSSSACSSPSSSSSLEKDRDGGNQHVASDDDDDGYADADADWEPPGKKTGGRRRERSRKKRRGGGGSRRGSDSGDSVDVEGDDGESSGGSDYSGEYRNGLSSPTGSLGSSEGERRKRDQGKARKGGKRERSYPGALFEGE